MTGKLSKSIKDKLIRQGQDILLPLVDVTGLGWKAEVEWDEDEVTVEIVFTNASKKSIIISNVWFDVKTGEINQYGSNYGMLVL